MVLSPDLFLKFLVLVLVIAIGYLAGRISTLGENLQMRSISQLANHVMVPALLFRTTARVDLVALPWHTLLAFFVPAGLVLLGVYVAERRLTRDLGDDPGRPAVRALTATFGNTVQMGLPMVTALFGEPGLAILIAIVSMHALTLLTSSTLLIEMDLARAAHARGQGTHLWATIAQTARQTLIHPVILPVVAGLAWNFVGVPFPDWLDGSLGLIASGVVPVCLLLTGLSLAHYGMGGAVGAALALSALKLVALPTVVLGAAHWGFGLTGLPLAVLVLTASLPTGTNPLLFAQRYRSQEREATATITMTTVSFLLAAPLWLWVVKAL